ncbi:hypothetical protein TrRE_jg12703 [Triparma retinervis]|uniref:Uncharacterized protein n=1 Tax=Triparma retinervis TaxID=2557542 RepID=A0A9W7DNJ4_9STRA|nr:hypothetical protein TrRE_jg12703 [Triparma retinervis]
MKSEVVVNQTSPTEATEDTDAAASPPKQLTKAEKKALKAAEMDDLDAMLNEFGVDANAAPAASESPNATPAPTAPSPTGEGDKKKKKKKKQQKKKKAQASDADEDDGEVIDIKKVLAAKQKAKASTPEGIAAAKAAADEKKKEESKKKKKKEKNTGSGGKKKDITRHVGHSSNF